VRNPFSWDYLTAPVWETPVWGPFSIAFLAVFGVGFITAMFFYYDSQKRLGQNPILLRVVQRGTIIAMSVFGVGLFFFLMRFLQVSAIGLHMRLWLYLCALAAIIMLASFWYYVRRVYPARIAEYEVAQRKREYLSRPARGSAAAGGRRRRSRRKGRA
jgi:hypothetical protein